MKSIWSRLYSWILRQFPFYSLCLYFIHFSLLCFLFYATEIRFLGTKWILSHSLKADSFGGVPIPLRPLISQLPYSKNPWLSYTYLSPHISTLSFFPFFFFFLRKDWLSLQTLSDFSGRVKQRNLFHSSTFLKQETSWTCLWQRVAESHFKLHASLS